MKYFVYGNATQSFLCCLWKYVCFVHLVTLYSSTLNTSSIAEVLSILIFSLIAYVWQWVFPMTFCRQSPPPRQDNGCTWVFVSGKYQSWSINSFGIASTGFKQLPFVVVLHTISGPKVPAEDTYQLLWNQQNNLQYSYCINLLNSLRHGYTICT